MKAQKIYKIVLVVVFACFRIAAMSQPAGWEVNPNLFDYSMTITGKVSVDGAFSVDENDVVAAFIDGECRGITNVKYQSALSDYFVFLMIYNDEPTGTVTFKIYDASADKEVEVLSQINFIVNDIKGSISSPFLFSGNNATFEAKITSITIPNQKGHTTIYNLQIIILQETGGDLSNIIASFNLSLGAKAYVNGVEQKSGITANNFKNPVFYSVVSGDGTVTNVYKVIVSQAIDESTEIFLSNSKLKENVDSVFVGQLSAVSNTLGSSYDFSFVDDTDTENGFFFIKEKKLFAKNRLNFEEKSHYKLKIRVDNKKGITKDKYFNIEVLNENDPPTEILFSTKTLSESTKINTSVALLTAEDQDFGDLHTFSLKAGNGINDEGNAMFVINGDSLILMQALNRDQKDAYNILVMVTDSSGATFEKEWSFQVVDINYPPQFTASPQAYAIQNQVYVYNVKAEDKEGDKLTYSFEGLPTWLTFNENTKLLTGVPHNEDVEDFQFKIKVSDGVKESEQTVYISVLNINDPPEITQYPGTQYFYTGMENSITLPANSITDPDVGDKLTFKLSGENNSALPVWMSFNPETLTIIGNPPENAMGTYNLKLSATDAGRLKEWLVFGLEVTFPTAIDEQKKNVYFNVFPNPVQNILYLNISDKSTNAKISIINTTGQVVKNVQFSAGQAKMIPMNGIEPGIYFVRYRQGELEHIKKIIKE